MILPESIVISIIGGIIASIALIARLLYASKCKTVSLCGCCIFERDTENEKSLRNIQL
jgi:hypothetical protein